MSRHVSSRLPARGADVLETHISTVAFDGDVVHKRKKDVRFPFIDLSTPERREAICRREVELNSRFSPDVYLGVEEVVDDDGVVVDHAVRMRRMPADRRLSTLARGTADIGSCLRQIARLIAIAHAEGLTNAEISSVATTVGAAPALAPEPRRARTLRPGATRSRDTRRDRHPRRSLPRRVGRGCSRTASDEAVWSTVTATCSPTTSTASTMAPGSSIASSSTTACDGATCSTTSGSSRWTSNGSAGQTSHRRSWPGIASSRPRRTLSHWRITTSRIERSCARRSRACAEAAPTTTRHVPTSRSALVICSRARLRLVLIGGLPGSGKSTLATAPGRRARLAGVAFGRAPEGTRGPRVSDFSRSPVQGGAVLPSDNRSDLCRTLRSSKAPARGGPIHHHRRVVLALTVARRRGHRCARDALGPARAAVHLADEHRCRSSP